MVATDIFHASILLWAAGIADLVGGNVDLAATGWLTLGSIPEVLVGSQLTVRLPEQGIRAVLGIVVLVSEMKLAAAF
ncbi:MAG: hypothetical protein OXG37_13385 [Actinomycetia bacterium]|nr:hypothetical protein [Actinomycetes bacterium]